MKSPITIAALIALVCMVIYMWPVYRCIYVDEFATMRCLHGFHSSR